MPNPERQIVTNEKADFFTTEYFWLKMPRVRVNDVCLNYHDPGDVIITSRMAISELVYKDNKNILPF